MTSDSGASKALHDGIAQPLLFPPREIACRTFRCPSRVVTAVAIEAVSARQATGDRSFPIATPVVVDVRHRLLRLFTTIRVRRRFGAGVAREAIRISCRLVAYPLRQCACRNEPRDCRAWTTFSEPKPQWTASPPTLWWESHARAESRPTGPGPEVFPAQ